MMESEIINGQILSKKNNYLIGTDADGSHPRIIKSRRFKDYEKAFLAQCVKYKDKRISVPFTLYLAVYNENDRFDVDGAITTALDCLQMAHAIVNDNLCIKVIAEKRLSPQPRIEFAIVPLQESLF